MGSDRVRIEGEFRQVIRNPGNQLYVADGLIANRELRYLERSLQTRIFQGSAS